MSWVRRGAQSWLALFIAGAGIETGTSEYSATIERLARLTNHGGAKPLWEGYEGFNRGGPARLPDEVRITAPIGDCFTTLVRARRPRNIVEFGTAFGVSGMYFLAGLEAINEGRLLTFEPNTSWARLAEHNLAQIGDRFQLTVGTFEDHVDSVLPPSETIDLAFIDAIHTSAFVLPQLERVVARSSPGALILLDDIDFSDDMRECWHTVATDPRVVASATLDRRVGVVELMSTRS